MGRGFGTAVGCLADSSPAWAAQVESYYQLTRLVLFLFEMGCLDSQSLHKAFKLVYGSIWAMYHLEPSQHLRKWSCVLECAMADVNIHQDPASCYSHTRKEGKVEAPRRSFIV